MAIPGNQRRKRELLAPALFSILLMVGPAGTVEAQEGPTDFQSAYATHFRAKYGLDHGAILVASSYSDPDYSAGEFGLPLTPEEASVVWAFVEFTDGMQPAIDYALDQDDLSGVYFDDLPSGGRARFFFTGSISDHRHRIEELSPAGADTTVTQRSPSMVELRTLQRQVANFNSLSEHGIEAVAVGVDEKLGQVVVSLAEEASGSAIEYLHSEFGENIATELLGPTEFDTCTSRSHCLDPVKGGLHIIAGGSFCTSAFVARNGGNTKRLVTAGHCVKDDGTGPPNQEWVSGGGPSVIGRAVNHTIKNPDPVIGYYEPDVGWLAFDVTPVPDFTPATKVYAQNTGNVVLTWDFQATDAQQAMHSQVCRSGATTDYVCGHIERRGDIAKVTTGGYMIDHVFIIDEDASGGDSGGPLIKTIAVNPGLWIQGAAGVHSYSVNDTVCLNDHDKCRSWYTTAGRMTTETGLTVCLSTGNC